MNCIPSSSELMNLSTRLRETAHCTTNTINIGRKFNGIRNRLK